MSQEKEYTDFQIRVIQERHELEEKLIKLKAFMESEFFKTLSEVSQGLLTEQAVHMDGYLKVLDARIELF